MIGVAYRILDGMLLQAGRAQLTHELLHSNAVYAVNPENRHTFLSYQ